MGNYIFTLTPTFTQGLILGQLSILLLVYFILKYLFFDSKSVQHLEDPTEEDAPAFRPSFSAEKFIPTAFLQKKVEEQDDEEHHGGSAESAEWLNVLLKQVSRSRAPGTFLGLIHEAWAEYQQIVDEYRCKLRATEGVSNGEKVALQRIQDLANEVRPQPLLVRSHITVAMHPPRIVHMV
jgi:maintenance of mitochondrial morphology protein 1